MGEAKYNPTPTGVIDGSNRDFSVDEAYVAGSILHALNGVWKIPSDDDGLDEIDASAGTVRLKEAPLTDDRLIFFYTDTSTDPLVYTVIQLTGRIEPVELSGQLQAQPIAGALAAQEIAGAITSDRLEGQVAPVRLVGTLRCRS